MSGVFSLRALAALGIVVVGAGSVTANETPVRVVGEPGAVATATDAERFCENIADSARDRRYAIQTEELRKLQGEIDARMAALEAKRREYQGWLERREAFLAKAEDGVVKIYKTMKPDAAAERLAELKAELAAAILMKLESRKAATILNEMETKRAAVLTAVMAAAARTEDPS
ncbi:MAG: hypothetical protein DI629_02830 [Mesorhizobium amorphae]|nr:MAG: hypothetical protein DI629_02830 [Mesorhizobium amorphae]